MSAVLSLSHFSGWGAWRKPDNRPWYEWARDNIKLPASFSMPGPFDVEKSRPLKWVFNGLQDDFVRSVHFRKPVRFGGTLIVDVAIPAISCNAPGPMMWVWPADPDAKAHLKEKAWPMWNKCAPFARLLAALGRNDKTITDIYFGAFFLNVAAANINSLQGKGIRYLFCEEIWLPVWQDMFSEAVARTRDYERVGNSKILATSQAGNKGDVEDRNFKAGNQGVWAYQPSSGPRVPLLFGGKREDGTRWGLVFNDDAKRPDGTYNVQRACETARYICKETGQVWADSPRTIADWNRDGAFIDLNPTAPRHLRSYAVNALLNRSFASLVEEKLNAMEYARRGDMAPLKAFKQKAETLPWEEEYLTITVAPRADSYTYKDHFNGQPWEGEVDRFMTIDRQQGMAGDVPHWWVDARAWKINGDSRQLYFGRVETIEAVREIQLRLGIIDSKTFEDAGYDAPAVYLDCARFGWRALFGSPEPSWTHLTTINGVERKFRLPYSPPQKTRATNGRPVYYFHFSSDYMKDILANLVSGRGAQWQLPDDVSKDYVAHLQSEAKKEKKPGVFKWEKLHSTKPNHGWDTSTMQIVPALIARRLGMLETQQTLPATPPQS